MNEEKKKFLKKFEKIKDLPSLPVIVAKINQMLDDPYTTIESLSNAIEKDQAIVFKMLLLVNSAFFGFREKISSVSEAAIILGFDAIRNIVISISTFTALNRISSKKSIADFMTTSFWNHSVAVAVLSKYLSDKTGIGDSEKCFVGGLLHDMGKLILACYFTDDFKKVLGLAKQEKILYREAEVKIIPCGHQEIGYFVTKKWNLPPHLTNTVYSHHALQAGAPSFDESLIVNTADGIINSYYVDFLNNNTRPGEINYRYFDENAQERMKLWIESSSKWFSEVEKLISEARELFLKNGND